MAVTFGLYSGKFDEIIRWEASAGHRPNDFLLYFIFGA
jgi:hypothetical protein